MVKLQVKVSSVNCWHADFDGCSKSVHTSMWTGSPIMQNHSVLEQQTEDYMETVTWKSAVNPRTPVECVDLIRETLRLSPSVSIRASNSQIQIPPRTMHNVVHISLQDSVAFRVENERCWAYGIPYQEGKSYIVLIFVLPVGLHIFQSAKAVIVRKNFDCFLLQ